MRTIFFLYLAKNAFGGFVNRLFENYDSEEPPDGTEVVNCRLQLHWLLQVDATVNEHKGLYNVHCFWQDNRIDSKPGMGKALRFPFSIFRGKFAERKIDNNNLYNTANYEEYLCGILD